MSCRTGQDKTGLDREAMQNVGGKPPTSFIKTAQFICEGISRSSHSTIDMVFTLRQLQEKAVEQNKPLYIVFVDFSKRSTQSDALVSGDFSRHLAALTNVSRGHASTGDD